MNPASLRILSVTAACLMVAAIVLLFVGGNLFSALPAVIAAQAAALVLSGWARLTFGWRSFHFPANPTPGGLVTTGPYRFIRHPIYAAVWLFTWAGVAAHLHAVTAALAVVILAALVVRLRCEERFLWTHFPGYPAYARHTARLIPFIW